MLGKIKLEDNQKQGIINKLNAEVKVDIAYLGLALISSLIATFALLIDDIAILVGAMLIAPFLTPALAIGMGLVKGEFKLLKRGVVVLAIGVGVGIIASIIIATLSPIKEVTEAISDRTAPTLIQLIIAFLAGGAAAFSYAHKRIRAVLSGAFVALALVPPISIIGIGVAFLNLQIVGGAALLLAANVIGLALATVIIFFLFGFRPINTTQNIREVKVGLTWLASLFLIIALPLGYIMTDIIKNDQEKEMVSKTIKQKITQIDGAKIDDLNLSRKDNKLKVSFHILASKGVDNQIIREIKNDIEKKLNKKITIDAKLIPTYEIDY